LKLIPI